MCPQGCPTGPRAALLPSPGAVHFWHLPKIWHFGRSWCGFRGRLLVLRVGAASPRANTLLPAGGAHNSGHVFRGATGLSIIALISTSVLNPFGPGSLGSILTLQGPEPLCSPRLRRAGLFVCLPSTSSEGAGGRQSAGNAAEEACGFIWRLHNGTFTQRLAGGNWVDECLVMPPVQRVNSQDLAYIISREHLRPLLCLFPGALWHRCIPGSFCACRFPNKPAHLLGPRPR